MKEAPRIAEVFVTKYALTKGILRFTDVEHCANTSTNMVCVSSLGYFHGSDWHRTLAEAQKKAEEMRIAKLKALDRQAKKIAKLDFNTVREASRTSRGYRIEK